MRLRRLCRCISIHAPRGGSDTSGIARTILSGISIHAPRGGERPPVLAHKKNRTNFNPRSPWGERLRVHTSDVIEELFQSTLPVGGATGYISALKESLKISIHAPRGGSDKTPEAVAKVNANFNPRSPWGERPKAAEILGFTQQFQSTLPVGGATKPSMMQQRQQMKISIHAPRGGSDFDMCFCKSDCTNISIHAPRGGSDANYHNIRKAVYEFQSTLPVGGATGKTGECLHLQGISIHAPRGGSDFPLFLVSTFFVISIHAPRGGSDGLIDYYLHCTSNFNPRSPWGERLAIDSNSNEYTVISIHAPRGGSDKSTGKLYRWDAFQSTLPVGGATKAPGSCTGGMQFQSTLPVGGATKQMASPQRNGKISIHAPRGGSDTELQKICDAEMYFNPRSPWGERHVHLEGGKGMAGISIHAPRGGSDGSRADSPAPTAHFNPRSPWGERPMARCRSSSCRYFNPRSPWGERLAQRIKRTPFTRFQSTLPVGGATYFTTDSGVWIKFQSTLPVGGATIADGYAR